MLNNKHFGFNVGNRGMLAELEAVGIEHTPIGRDITSRHGSRAEWMNDWIAEYSSSMPPIGCVLVGYVQTCVLSI